jgi:hypothetical protein
MIVPSLEIDAVLRPQTCDDLQRLIRPPPARCCVDMQRLPLGSLRTADAEPRQQPPLRQHIDRGTLLGQQNRIAQRQRHHVDSELDALRAPGDRGERRHAFKNWLAADDAVGLPDRVDPTRFAQIDPSPEPVGAGEWKFHQPRTDRDVACHDYLLRWLRRAVQAGPSG